MAEAFILVFHIEMHILALVLILATSAFSKDITSFPYEAKKTDFAVGALGGTGCSRHWDFMDFKDFSHLAPADRCGKYALVSPRHHKWVDMSVYGREKYRWMVWPIHGDGILEKAVCDIPTSTAIYVLKQYLVCGGVATSLALCDESGADVAQTMAQHCR